MNELAAKERAEAKGHAMGRVREGRTYCLHRDCNATLTARGKLGEVEWNGSAANYECPFNNYSTTGRGE